MCLTLCIANGGTRGKSTEASGLLTRDSRLAKEDAISTRKGGQHQKEKHQVNILCHTRSATNMHYVQVKCSETL